MTVQEAIEELSKQPMDADIAVSVEIDGRDGMRSLHMGGGNGITIKKAEDSEGSVTVWIKSCIED